LKLLKDKGNSAVSIEKLDQYMRNTHNTQFTYDVFKAAYDSDPRLKTVVTNFDQDKIEFKQSEVDDVKSKGVSGPKGDTVGNMAKNATDVGAEL